MLRTIVVLLGILVFNPSQAQEEKDYFITVWDLSLDKNNKFTSIEFYSLTTGDVNYTWETIPAGTSSSGKFSSNNQQVTISNLPSNAKIRLKLVPQNLKRFYFDWSYKLIDITQWGKVEWTSMEQAFKSCLNLNITTTDVPDLTGVGSTKEMFIYCRKLNSPNNINSWNTQNVTDMSGMFYEANSFNQPIGNWNTQNVIDVSRMFIYANSFNQPIGNWNTQNVTNMSGMFQRAISFNQPIGAWNTQNVKDLSGMFGGASSFNQPIGNWNTQNVTDMKYMFSRTNLFNQPIGEWNTQNVTDMSQMFYEANSFNQPIGNWNTQNVTNMSYMFYGAGSFSQPLGNWNTQNVKNMSSMFYGASSFNQPIGNWNTQKVTEMWHMFYKAKAFNQRLDSLELNPSIIFAYPNFQTEFMLDYCGIDCKNYSYTLIGWANNPNTPTNRVFGAAGLKYSTTAQAARTILTKPVNEGGKGWTIEGDALTTEDCGIITNTLVANEEVGLGIYPNPTKSVLFIKNPSIGTSYKIIDAIGSVQSEGVLSQEQISVSQLPAGLYTLLYRNNHFTFVKED